MKKQSPSACAKWLNTYNVSNEIFFRSLSLTKQATNETKLIAFQFKIVHNILNTRENLKKWDISDSEICNCCNENYVDDFVHEFTGCKLSKQIVCEAAKNLSLTNEFKKISKTDFVFGSLDPAINNIILLLKYTMHTARQTNSCFSVVAFRKELYKRIESDSKTLPEYRFNAKWATHLELVSCAKTFFQNLCA